MQLGELCGDGSLQHHEANHTRHGRGPSYSLTFPCCDCSAKFTLVFIKNPLLRSAPYVVASKEHVLATPRKTGKKKMNEENFVTVAAETLNPAYGSTVDRSGGSDNIYK